MSDHIYQAAERLAKRAGSRDPFEALDFLHVKVMFSDRHPADGLKGFCTVALRTKYVVINSNMDEHLQPVVAAHELGHILLHSNGGKLLTFSDNELCANTSRLEREAK